MMRSIWMPRRNHHTDKRLRPYSAFGLAKGMPLSDRIRWGSPYCCPVSFSPSVTRIDLPQSRDGVMRRLYARGSRAIPVVRSGGHSRNRPRPRSVSRVVRAAASQSSQTSFCPRVTSPLCHSVAYSPYAGPAAEFASAWRVGAELADMGRVVTPDGSIPSPQRRSGRSNYSHSNSLATSDNGRQSRPLLAPTEAAGAFPRGTGSMTQPPPASRAATGSLRPRSDDQSGK